MMVISINRAEPLRTVETAETRQSIEAWLRRALADRYSSVADEALPEEWLRLLPPE